MVAVSSLRAAFRRCLLGSEGCPDSGDEPILNAGVTPMKIVVLKVRQKKNLVELDLAIERGRTLEEDFHDGPEPGGWKMLKDAQPGDLAVWYAASPDQEYRAWGWVVGRPVPSPVQPGIYFGPVAGVRRLGPIPFT
jgi:hypothetical protein